MATLSASGHPWIGVGQPGQSVDFLGPQSDPGWIRGLLEPWAPHPLPPGCQEP